ncbi:MAG: hypothetical protein JWO36_5222 [Myxococcales bacterium]|nr:hypothetical protein [Myxococcales bacterium]
MTPRHGSLHLGRYGWLAAIAVAYLYVFPYFPRIHSANELPRVYLVKAIVEDHTFAIDRGVDRWGGTADMAPWQGHQYSNKAPGSSLIAVPVYAVVSWIGGEPSLAVSLWIARITSGVIPALLFLWLLSGFLERFVPDEATRRLLLIAYALGSMAMTYSILYFSHQLAAVCIGSAWILAIDVAERRRGMLAIAAAGALAGAAPLVDYQAAFAGVPIVIYLIWKLRAWPRREVLRLLLVASAAAAVPIVVLLWYHSVCFGSPWKTGYDNSVSFAHFHSQGFLGMTSLRWEAFYGSLFRPDNGLFVLAPWWLLAIPGGVVLWRRGDRATVLALAGVVLVFVLFVSSINFWRGGWNVGPRYITAMLPFMLPLVGVALGSLRGRPWLLGVACGTIVSAVIIYCLSSATFPYWPDSMPDPLYEVTFRLLGDHAVAPNLGQAVGATGLLSIAPFVLGISALLGWAIQRVAGWRGLASAVVVGIAITMAFGLVSHGGAVADRGYMQTVRPAVAQ